MYFPILRGRQFELLALRECVGKNILSNRIIPILEPVKASSTYTKTVDSFIKAKWRHKNVEHVEKGREYFLGIVLSGAGIRVVSRDRFIAKPHLTVTFHGCEVLDYLDQGESNFDRMVEPVLQKQDLLGISSRPSYLRVDLSSLDRKSVV